MKIFETFGIYNKLVKRMKIFKTLFGIYKKQKDEEI